MIDGAITTKQTTPYSLPIGFNELFEAIEGFDPTQAPLEALETQHSALLKQLGLKIGGVVELDVHPTETQSKVLFKVIDQKLFESFLSSLNFESVKNPQFAGRLIRLADDLTSCLRAAFHDRTPNDTEFDLVISAAPALAHLKRLGLEKSCARLELYVGHIKDGTLQDLIRAEDQGLLTPVGQGFAPGDTKNNSFANATQQLWRMGLENLAALKESPKTLDLHTYVARHLEMLVANARQRAGALATSDRFERGNKDALQTVLKDAHRKLLPLAVNRVLVGATEAPAMEDMLFTLLRQSDSPTILSGNYLYKDLMQTDSAGIAIHHKSNGELIGFLCARPTFQEDEGDIVALELDSRYRGVGLEKLLIDALPDHPLAKGYRTMRLVCTQQIGDELITQFGKRAEVINRIMRGSDYDPMLRIRL